MTRERPCTWAWFSVERLPHLPLGLPVVMRGGGEFEAGFYVGFIPAWATHWRLPDSFGGFRA